MVTPGVRVEGVRDLTRGLNRAGRQDLTKEMGRENKGIGDDVIARLQPLPATVGLGAGARVRSSANARLVQLFAGGKHRSAPSTTQRNVRPWGKRPAGRRRTSKRPHIAGTAVRALPRIEKRYLAGVDRALRNAGLE